MKKEVFVLLLGILLISQFVSAQEQVQTYEGFNRFVDNVRMFFTFRQEGKVSLSLEIREKEVNSAIVNEKNENKEKAEKNLEMAWERLQFIQEKVSLETAEKVKESSSNVLNSINEEKNLSESFEVYSLEEEKTGLTAEWVIEVNGKEGQTMTNEVVVNRTVEQNRKMEIETRIDKIDNEISNWVVEHTYAEGTTAGGEAGVVVEGGLAKVVENEIAQGDNGLKPEVKTSVAKNEKVTNGDGGYAEGTSGNSPGDTIDETYDDDSVNKGDCGEGVVCGGENDIIEGGEGSEGTNEISPASESGGSGDSGSSSENSNTVE